MDRSEDYILNKVLCNPTCCMTLERDDAKVTLEQSLELTWYGPVEKCRELVKSVLPEDVSLNLLSKLKLIEKDGPNTIYGAIVNGAKVTFTMRGEIHQAPALLRTLLKFGGVTYFDRSVEDRRRYG